MSANTTRALGIDIGRVIIGPTIDGVADTSFLGTTVEEAMRTPPAPDAFAAIAQLVERFEGRVWLVSKCGPSVERKSLLWLDWWRFYAKTGVPRGNVRFCRERRDKAVHAREIGMTHFIDDRLDVLEPMRGEVPHLLAFGEDVGRVPRWAAHVRDWRAVLEWFDWTDADSRPRT